MIEVSEGGFFSCQCGFVFHVCKICICGFVCKINTGLVATEIGGRKTNLALQIQITNDCIRKNQVYLQKKVADMSLITQSLCCDTTKQKIFVDCISLLQTHSLAASSYYN